MGESLKAFTLKGYLELRFEPKMAKLFVNRNCFNCK